MSRHEAPRITSHAAANFDQEQEVLQQTYVSFKDIHSLVLASCFLSMVSVKMEQNFGRETYARRKLLKQYDSAVKGECRTCQEFPCLATSALVAPEFFIRSEQ